MTNAEIALRGQKNTREIAGDDRKSRERIADKDRAYKKYDTDTRRDTADKDRAQKERSDARSANVAKRGQNLKVITDTSTAAMKLLPTMVAGAVNDPAWWSAGFSSEEQSHIIPINWKIDAYAPINQGFTADTLTMTIRDIGLCAKNTIPNWNADATGYVPTFTDAVNRAFQMLKTQLQKKAGYNLGFASSDIGLMLLACREIVSLSHFIGKVLRYTLKGQSYNSAYPTEVFKLLHVDYEDTVNNYSKYRAELEALLPLMDVLPTPNLPIMFRAAQLFGSTWMDDKYPSQEYQYKATRYHVRPLGFNILSTISEDTTSSLIFRDTTQFTTVSEYLSLLQEAIVQILKRDDFVEIAGRLADYYPNSWSYRDVNTSVEQVAVYEPFTLAQIHNAVCPFITTDSTLTSLDIKTTENGLIYQETNVGIEAYSGASYNEEEQLIFANTIDLPSDVPVSTGAIIDATRLRIGFRTIIAEKATIIKERNYMPMNLLVAWDFICNPEFLAKSPASDEFMVLSGFSGTGAIGANIPCQFTDALSTPLIVVASSNGYCRYVKEWKLDNQMNLPFEAFTAMNRMAALSALGVTGFFDH